jgi:putative ABC transport system permease protein
MRQGLVRIAIGLAAGLAGAILSGRVLSAYLFETAPRDPLVLAGVTVLFVIAGAAACAGPARRATGIDPLVALRSE